MNFGDTTTSRNETFTIGQLSAMVKQGRIRLPEFQRSFRWEAADVLKLFDSILRGYPFGSFLLWKRDAPEATLDIGAIRVHSEAQSDALWVVDGQQRITSLVNAVDPEAAATDARFRIFYSLDRRKVVAPRDVGTDLAIPLPDLVDFSRALGWLNANKDAVQYAEQVQAVTSLMNRVEVSAAVIEKGDEKLLRDIFDRINSQGKRLNSAEIFDAIHSSSSSGNKASSLQAISSRVSAATDFGMLDRRAVVQALLVRRHPDITRDVHTEFSPNRAAEGQFAGETELTAYEQTEVSLLHAVRFLQDRIGIPHLSFLPFRFQLLALVRFFALHPDPKPRNLELLKRWFWRSSLAANSLNWTGSTGNVRSIVGNIAPDDEDHSIQRLLSAVTLPEEPPMPDITSFRTNQATNGKLVLAALWALRPVNPATNEVISRSDIFGVLDDDTSPAQVTPEIFPRATDFSSARTAANRVIAIQDRHAFTAALSEETDLGSLLLDEEMLFYLNEDRRLDFITLRAATLKSYLSRFLRERMGTGLDSTPPLSSLDLDDDQDD